MKEQGLDSLTRREFLKLSGLAVGGLAIGGCAHTPSDGPATKIDEAPFTYNVISQRNPNYQGRMNLFYDVITQLYVSTPGVEFNCAAGTPMVASVDGRVFDINYGAHGAASGYTVMTATQPETRGKNFPWWNTYYGHLDKNLQVKKGQTVKRGQILGYVHSIPGSFGVTGKLMAREAPSGLGSEYWLNPDNYGEGYGHMDYWDGKTDMSSPSYIDKSIRQQAIIQNLIKMCNSKNAKSLPRKTHRAEMPWSIAEQFKYMQQLYKQKPESFSSNQEEIDKLIKEFYSIQPVILTLPFKKA